MATPYELVAEVVAHEGDIRSVVGLPGGGLASGSRDRLCKLWKATENGRAFVEDKALYEHEHWVSAVLALPAEMGLVTASQDKKLRWYDAQGALVATLAGHEGPVTSLAWNAKREELVSGSWDGTARLWRLDAAARSGDCVGTLAGHENGACVLALPSGDVVTGSAGVQAGNRIEGFQLRVWRDGKVAQTMKAHQGAIRCLCLAAADGSTFASASNDGTVRVWSSESFQELACFSNPPGPEGAPAFNFCVAPLGGFRELAAASDDCCARVWDTDSGNMAQEIPHPCTVWWVAALENGDLATGGSDGRLRVFSREDARKAPAEARQHYLEETQRTREAIANKTSNGGNKIDPEKLTKIYEAPPGTSEGDVKMFNKGGEAWVYQWSAVSGTWVEVGEVMGDAGGGKEELDGELFDKVIPVELEDPATGGLRKLKLGFNSGDNPFMVAQLFVQKHGLNEGHVQEIADFVQNVRGQSAVPTIDMSGAGAPASAPPAPMEVDQGAGAGPFPLPAATGLAFESVDLDKVLSKLEELNGSVNEPEQLTERELVALRSLVALLKETSRYHASSASKDQVAALERALRWPAAAVFPALDLTRVALTHADAARKLSASGGWLLPHALGLAAADGAPLPVALLGARVGANYFRHRTAVEAAVAILTGEAGVDKVAEPLQALAGFPNKNVRSAAATCLLNSANALHHLARTSTPPPLADALAATAAELGAACLEQGEKEHETARRCVLALGCLVGVQASCAARASELAAAAARAAAAGSTLADAAEALERAARRKHK